MPKQATQKAEAVYRSAKGKETVYRISDGSGLYMLVSPDGSRLWRFQYTRPTGGRNTLSLGDYPTVGTAAARSARDEARRLLSEGIDPGEHRKAVKASLSEVAANSLESIGLEWFAKFSPGWSESHRVRVKRLLERDIYPWLGKLPITEVTAPALLATVRRIEARGALETAHRALQNCGQVFRYAIATGRADRDVAADLRGALPPPKENHFAAVTEPSAIRELLQAIDGYHGGLIVKSALKLAPLVFVRPGELRRAEWSAIDLDAAEWRYLVTKTQTPHVVPLSRQAVDILGELKIMTGQGAYLFPSMRGGGKPMSENTVNAALRYLGFDGDTMTGHGFRAMARTVLDEVLGFRPDLIEHQLAHAVKDPNGRAYNRTAHLPERKRMMQAWADYLDKLKAGADVLPFRRVAL